MKFWRQWRFIRISALAFAAAALFASAAQAVPVVDQEGGTARVPRTATVQASTGFDWTLVEVGAGGVAGIVLVGGIVLAGGRRGRDTQPART